MVFQDNDGGLDDKKEFLHAKRWDVYVNEKENIIKGWYLVEVIGYDGKQVLWELIDNHVVQEDNDNDQIGLRGFYFNFFEKDKEGVGREGLHEYHYLSMLSKLWTGDWKNKLERMIIKAEEENGKDVVMVNVWY